jgi:hypothetical protein
MKRNLYEEIKNNYAELSCHLKYVAAINGVLDMLDKYRHNRVLYEIDTDIRLQLRKERYETQSLYEIKKL